MIIRSIMGQFIEPTYIKIMAIAFARLSMRNNGCKEPYIVLHTT